MKSAAVATQSQSSKLGIRELMLITVLAALLCAFLARMIRMFPAEEQFKGIAFILAVLVGMLAYIAGCVVWRSRLEKRAGARQFLSSGSRGSFHHVGGISSCILCLVCMALSLQTLSIEQSSVWPQLFQVCLFGSWSLNYLLNVFVWKVDYGSVDVRENGLILGGKHFVRWTFLTGYRWNKFSQKLMLLSDGGFNEWKVPEHRRAELAKAIDRFVPFKER